VRIEERADHQWAVFHQQPFDGLDRDPRAGPGRGITGRDFPGIGEAGFEARARLAVDDFDLVPGFSQIPSRGDADDAAPKHQHFHRYAPDRTALSHVTSVLRFWQTPEAQGRVAMPGTTSLVTSDGCDLPWFATGAQLR
jgi:hypothetical protein